ncbi:uncharacterized protein BKA78DRAFT_124942 [Phyllosticta capitalensis]|uniref:uncharacterized protein n=1 Tax=Phyllosticta capitalensis TaxID=121624 RepID=UPI0031317EEF
MITKTATMDWDGRWLDGYTHGHGKRAWYLISAIFCSFLCRSTRDTQDLPPTRMESYVATYLSESQKYLQTQQYLLALFLLRASPARPIATCNRTRSPTCPTTNTTPSNSQHQGAKQQQPVKNPCPSPQPFFPFPAPAHIIRPASGSVPRSAASIHAAGPKGKCRLIPHNFKRRSGLELGIRLPCVVADGG